MQIKRRQGVALPVLQDRHFPNEFAHRNALPVLDLVPSVRKSASFSVGLYNSAIPRGSYHDEGNEKRLANRKARRFDVLVILVDMVKFASR